MYSYILILNLDKIYNIYLYIYIFIKDFKINSKVTYRSCEFLLALQRADSSALLYFRLLELSCLDWLGQSDTESFIPPPMLLLERSLQPDPSRKTRLLLTLAVTLEADLNPEVSRRALMISYILQRNISAPNIETEAGRTVITMQQVGGARQCLKL